MRYKLLGVSLMIMVYIVAKRKKYPVHANFSMQEAVFSFIDGFLPLMTPIILLGGILVGVFSPIEAAIVASAYALIFGLFICREIKIKDLIPIIMNTVKTTSLVAYIISAFPMSVLVFQKITYLLFQ